MQDFGKFSVLGVKIAAIDYESAVLKIIDAAKQSQPFAVSALAVHGVITGATDPAHLRRLNGLALNVPDGQPVRWALRWLHGIKLRDRVYGPNLTLKVLAESETQHIPVYFYGSDVVTLDKLKINLIKKFPNLLIAGMEPSQFKKITESEKNKVVQRIKDSGAKIVFVGLGCPRQEVWAFEYQNLLSLPVIAVGAAFAFHAGTLAQAPAWMQSRGLEWLFRLIKEPMRLWKRYLFLNPLYLFLVFLQKLEFRKFPDSMPDGAEEVLGYG